MIQAAPLVSCLTATFNRLVRLKESIRCYCAQQWEPREMVIATDGSARYRQAVRDYITGLGRSDIRLIELDGSTSPAANRLTLGEIRNVLLDAARGDLVCQWDDDDLFHPLRLQAQVRQLDRQDAGACFLTDQLHLFWDDRELFWVDWRVGRENISEALIPGTLLMVSDSRFRYPAQRLHEDSALLGSLREAGVPLCGLSEHGLLYGRVYHGDNSFDASHHRSNAEAHAQSASFVRARLPELMETITFFRVPRPVAIGVRDAGGGLAFLEGS